VFLAKTTSSLLFLVFYEFTILVPFFLSLSPKSACAILNSAEIFTKVLFPHVKQGSLAIGGHLSKISEYTIPIRTSSPVLPSLPWSSEEKRACVSTYSGQLFVDIDMPASWPACSSQHQLYLSPLKKNDVSDKSRSFGDRGLLCSLCFSGDFVKCMNIKPLKICSPKTSSVRLNPPPNHCFVYHWRCLDWDCATIAKQQVKCNFRRKQCLKKFRLILSFSTTNSQVGYTR